MSRPRPDMEGDGTRPPRHPAQLRLASPPVDGELSPTRRPSGASRSRGSTGDHPLTATADPPDNRDWLYRPPPVQLKTVMAKPRGLKILDQGTEGACTGFGLAAVINLLNQRRGAAVRVSPRMLYEMARKHDEWPGEAYAGSSCRGAIKGFAQMGVCRDSYWPYRDDRPGGLTVKAARDARANTIGAYYRLEHRVSDFHAALNEAGAIFCSADVHDGWESPAAKSGVIPLRSTVTGGHAFAIIGYNREGFWVQNSWGRTWGQGGLALWSYEDWHAHLTDAWVLSLALPTPQIWCLGEAERASTRGGASNTGRAPARGQIAGHFIHMDDGKFHDAGDYWSNLADVQATAANLAASTKYDHLLIYAHGGLNSPKDSARRIAAMRDVFKDNRVYPLHVMYDTGILEEIKDIVVARGEQTGARAGGVSDWWDRVLERMTRRLGRALWREMKLGACRGFEHNNAGVQTLRTFAQALRAGGGLKLKVHLAGHSTGGILLAHLLNALESIAPRLRLSTVSLLAPAASVALFKSHYYPLLGATRTAFGIDQMTVYNISDALEQDDTVGPYGKSLLYLVSRAFEEETPLPLLGMQRYAEPLAAECNGRVEWVVSHGRAKQEGRSMSTTHGGFDNNPATLNDILRRVVGKEPKRLFTPNDLNY